MKLIHFSDVAVDKAYSVKQFYAIMDGTPLGKPRGLWVSDETDPEQGWSGWCRSEGFRNIDEQYQYEVLLKPGANLLFLQTAEDIDRFTEKYQLKDSELNKMSSAAGRGFIHEIDWHKVAAEYNGIMITPYIYARRLTPHTMWYYGWDCASGCIWNADVVESLTLIKPAVRSKV